MNILVTGAAGYIGAVLCPALLAADHKVTAIDSFIYGPQQVMVLAACCANPNFTLVNADARFTNIVSVYSKQADVIIPLAAIVGMPACNKKVAFEIEDVNWHAVADLVASLSKNQLVIYPNTNSAYGSMPSGCNEPLDEDSPQHPLSLYAETKCRAEDEVRDHSNSVVFRLATVFGASPRMRTDLLVNDFVLRAVRDNTLTLFDANFRRNFVHVRDVVDAFLWAIESYTAYGLWGMFNLGNDDLNMTKRQLAQIIASHVPSCVVNEAYNKSDPDKRDYIVSNDRLAQAGFRAMRGLNEGIVELIKLYQAFPQTQWGNV